jgi:hypothetical protein
MKNTVIEAKNLYEHLRNHGSLEAEVAPCPEGDNPGMKRTASMIDSRGKNHTGNVIG